ncbi:hypothetical protein [Pseudomonas syringae]|nr:hypothetical protein [Pseudomonas syringae]
MEDNHIKMSLGSIVTTGATLIGGTAGIVIWIFTQYIIPLQISNYTQRNAELEQQATLLNNESSSRKIAIVKLEHELLSFKERRDEEIKKSNNHIKFLESKNLFVLGNPYPYMLDKVKVGDQVAKIKEAYPEGKIEASDVEQSRPYYIVRDVSTVFDRILYSYDFKTQKVTTVSYLVNDEYHDYKEFMLTKATDSLGTPYKSSVRNSYRWSNRKYGDVYLMGGDTYQIMTSDYSPMIWED